MAGPDRLAVDVPSLRAAAANLARLADNEWAKLPIELDQTQPAFVDEVLTSTRWSGGLVEAIGSIRDVASNLMPEIQDKIKARASLLSELADTGGQLDDNARTQLQSHNSYVPTPRVSVPGGRP